jgi:methylase of polypeptide subunit release factors
MPIDLSTDAPMSLDFDYARLRDVWLRHGLTASAWTTLTGQPAAASTLADDPAWVRHHLRAASPLATLFRWFTLGTTEPAAEVATALAPVSLDDLATAGVLEPTAQGVRCRFDLRLHDGVYCFNDRRGPNAGSNHVLGINPTAMLLASMTPRTKVRRAWDLGTGCGIQALLLARHAETVVASDINPRALHFAQVNARLNGVTNVEFRLGPWFEPVAGETFDLMVANPPFVISPDHQFAYRDGGLEGDGASAMIARQSGQYLTAEGIAVQTCNWALRPGSTDPAPKSWVAHAGTDALLLEGTSMEPVDYAVRWLRPHYPSDDDPSLAAAIERWLSYYRAQEMSALSFGILVQRRRLDPSGRFAHLRTPHVAWGSCGAQVLRLFQNQAFLAQHDTAENLLTVPFAAVPEVRLERALAATATGYQVQRRQLRMVDGLMLAEPLSAEAWQLWLRVTGGGTAAQALANWPGNDQVPDRAWALAALRHWLAQGFMIPCDAAATHTAQG